MAGLRIDNVFEMSNVQFYLKLHHEYLQRNRYVKSMVKTGENVKFAKKRKSSP